MRQYAVVTSMILLLGCGGYHPRPFVEIRGVRDGNITEISKAGESIEATYPRAKLIALVEIVEVGKTLDSETIGKNYAVVRFLRGIRVSDNPEIVTDVLMSMEFADNSRPRRHDTVIVAANLVTYAEVDLWEVIGSKPMRFPTQSR